MAAGMQRLILAAVLAGAWTARAQEGAPTPTNSTVITAKRLTFDYQNRFAVFDEKVVVVDPGVRIESDKLTVVFTPQDEPESATALGNVRIVQGDKVATADRAVYDVRTGKLVLNGNAQVHRGHDVVTGNKITFSRFDNTVNCDGEVRLVIFPQDGGSGGLGTFLKE